MRLSVLLCCVCAALIPGLHLPGVEAPAKSASPGKVPENADKKPAKAPGDPVIRQLALLDPQALGRAIDDLGTTFPAYPAAAFRARLEALGEIAAARVELKKDTPVGKDKAAAWLKLQREALLANPLVDFSKLLLVRRSEKSPSLGLPQNWQSNCALPKIGYDNELTVLSPVTPDGSFTSLYQPSDGTFIGDVELHPDAGKLMFSQSDPKGTWQVYEITADGAGRRQVTPNLGPDVDNYTSCYLPGGDILFTSTATMVAVPCVNGGNAVADLYRLSADGKNVRQLCFDQEHNWCPTVMNDGRILYQRWEYADLVHSNSRRLMTMNPDGTAQMAFYGSSGMWPNSLFYAKPIPGRPSQVVGIVGGHHGVPRMGELVLFDTAKGRKETEGVVQRIPGFGKPVARVAKDQLVNDSWPKFLHPWPLGRADGTGSGKYFLASCKPTPDAPWGLYLVDVFDNLLLLKETPGQAYLEPIPLRQRPTPPVIPSRVNPERKDAQVYLADIYAGPGLAGIPKGEVKSLRVFTYVYGYRGFGGLYGTIGMNGPWDVRRILGTVPVESDGSALFTIPANTPVAVQPLDKDGKALQIMRSWFVGMPGEVVSCVGCHEPTDQAPAPRATLAARKPPTDLEAWYGKTRGFSFAREVQPVLDKNCISCHDGSAGTPGKAIPDLRGEPLVGWNSKMPGAQYKGLAGKFTVGYANLHRFVRHPGIESDIAVLTPMDYHADTTELIQLLRKGHHGVNLGAEDLSRITTWIDLNTPFHGDWTTIVGAKAAEKAEKRRAELRSSYAQVDDYQIDGPVPAVACTTTPSGPAVEAAVAPSAPTIVPPATRVAAPASGFKTRNVDLGDGLHLTLTWIPPGSVTLGGANPDEQPASPVTIAKGFWMGTTEITNAQYRRFDPTHDSRRESKQGYQFGIEGYPLFKPQQPVVRVSWTRARDFCAWLGKRTGAKVDLPTEAQWEYACRAGTTTPFSFGAADADFSPYANCADITTKELASDPYTEAKPIDNPSEFDDWLPKDLRFNDHALVTSEVGGYQANPWGLQDMHGNAAEWTRSLHRPYPYVDGDGRNVVEADGERVVRGGSWRDRPTRCASGYRLAYRPYQQVYNVGFRVMVEDLPGE